MTYGTLVGDLAQAAGVRHLIYSSANAVSFTRTGVAHFDTKARIEQHLRTLDLAVTIIRPAAFMEILLPAGIVLGGSISFLMHVDQPMQFIAVDDIGKIVVRLFTEPERNAGRTIEIAGDTLTGPSWHKR